MSSAAPLNLDKIKALLQQQFSDGLLTIVGSGLSCAEGLPGMKELAAHLAVNIPLKDLTVGDRDRWNVLIAAIHLEGLESALLKNAPSPTLETEIASSTAELFANREKQIVQDIFLNGRKLRFTNLLSHMLKQSGGTPIITTNYDRLIEIAVEEAGIGVDTMFVGQFAGSLNEIESRYSFCQDVKLNGRHVVFKYRPRAIVFKPHGSLDWYHRDGAPVRYAGDLDCPRLIITPGLNKFRNGYESPFDIHREKANAAIDKARRFLIIGYGFNDDHLETHLGPRIRSGIPTLLITRTLSDNAKKLTMECGNVIAIEHSVHAGKDGSSIIVDKTKIEVPGLSLWDLDQFIKEVLEP